VTQTQVSYSGNQVATVVARDTTHADAVVIDAVARFCPQLDHREVHDVFIVTSEGSGGGHVVRTVYAADQDDARQTHQENYADEPIVEVHQ
jgi:hypothetical protein